MAYFVAFRYPGESAYFLESSDFGEDVFDFVSFDKKSISIKGVLQPYKDQLKEKYISNPIANHIATKKEFIAQSNKIKSIIQSSNTHKIVLSRIHQEEASKCNLHDIFESLSKKYTKELVYIVQLEDSIWCGATPEILAFASDEIIKTVALASTKLVSEQRDWIKKEVLEHRYIEDFYHQLAKDQDIPILSKSKTEDVQTGELLHLKSIFQFEVSPRIHSSFIDQLHPTPAVSGLPQKIAIQHITEIEQHDRTWYTGYLGVRTESTCQYYVNLRCMQLGTNASYIYVGGGHTIDSDAEAEWQETVNKSRAMQSILFQCKAM